MPVCEICGEEFKNTQGLSGHMRLQHQQAAEKSQGQETSLVPSKALPLDAVVQRLRLPLVPEMYNGMREAYVAGFNDGTEYGINTVLTGIRAAQELSALGIQQAQPLIKMAQEMRQSEQEAAREAVQDGLGRMMPYLDDRLKSVEEAARQRYTTQNPMAEMFARVMEMPLKNLVGRMFGEQQQTEPSSGTSIPGWEYVDRTAKGGEHDQC